MTPEDLDGIEALAVLTIAKGVDKGQHCALVSLSPTTLIKLVILARVALVNGYTLQEVHDELLLTAPEKPNETV